MKCDDKFLELLLEADDGSNDHPHVTQHVDACDRCQTRLVQLAADADDWDETKRWLAQDSLLKRSVAETSGDEVGEFSVNDSVRPWQRGHRQRAGGWTEAMAKSLLAPPSHPELLGRIGRYDVERLIGSGGMGVVFKAYDNELNRPVAVKLLAPYLAENGSARKRFAREARAAAAVVDEHVVAIHNVESGDAPEQPPFLVMKYIAGGSLQERLDRDGPLDVCEILRIGMQTAKGLAAAHAQGLIHRDVKPSNILLDEGVDRALLTDFGLARAEDDACLTRSGFQPGTPHYMSPEQVRGEAIDGRSDLFGLGCVLYALCTGHPPFRAETSYAVLRRITDDAARPIRELNPEISEWLEGIVMKLLSKSREDRFDSSEQVAELLEDCLAHVQDPTTTPLPEQAAVASPVRGRRPPWGKFIAAAAFSFSLIFAGVLIVLELNKGTLTIESDVDGVPIRILKDGETVDRLTVQQSGETIRIAAGNYVVVVDSPADEVTVKDGVVSLRRGENEIVKIVHVAAQPHAPKALAPADLENKRDEYGQLNVSAPLSGIVQTWSGLEGSDTTKEGDRLAVEMKVSGNEMPLIHEGDLVRLQFEGWPAVEFDGVPSVATGTFGGKVNRVYPTDDGEGYFRVIVTPDKNFEGDADWPDARYLRPGVRAKGWVLLRKTSLGSATKKLPSILESDLDKQATAESPMSVSSSQQTFGIDGETTTGNLLNGTWEIEISSPGKPKRSGFAAFSGNGGMIATSDDGTGPMQFIYVIQPNNNQLWIDLQATNGAANGGPSRWNGIVEASRTSIAICFAREDQIKPHGRPASIEDANLGVFVKVTFIKRTAGSIISNRAPDGFEPTEVTNLDPKFDTPESLMKHYADCLFRKDLGGVLVCLDDRTVHMNASAHLISLCQMELMLIDACDFDKNREVVSENVRQLKKLQALMDEVGVDDSVRRSVAAILASAEGSNDELSIAQFATTVLRLVKRPRDFIVRYMEFVDPEFDEWYESAPAELPIFQITRNGDRTIATDQSSGEQVDLTFQSGSWRIVEDSFETPPEFDAPKPMRNETGANKTEPTSAANPAVPSAAQKDSPMEVFRLYSRMVEQRNWKEVIACMTVDCRDEEILESLTFIQLLSIHAKPTDEQAKNHTNPTRFQSAGFLKELEQQFPEMAGINSSGEPIDRELQEKLKSLDPVERRKARLSLIRKHAGVDRDKLFASLIDFISRLEGSNLDAQQKSKLVDIDVRGTDASAIIVNEDNENREPVAFKKTSSGWKLDNLNDESVMDQMAAMHREVEGINRTILDSGIKEMREAGVPEDEIKAFEQETWREMKQGTQPPPPASNGNAAPKK